jgi:hypothetical protein
MGRKAMYSDDAKRQDSVITYSNILEECLSHKLGIGRVRKNLYAVRPGSSSTATNLYYNGVQQGYGGTDQKGHKGSQKPQAGHERKLAYVRNEDD